MIRSSVVLPQPEGPSSAKNSPSRIARLTPSRAEQSANRRDTRSTSTANGASRARVAARFSIGFQQVKTAAGYHEESPGHEWIETSSFQARLEGGPVNSQAARWRASREPARRGRGGSGRA